MNGAGDVRAARVQLALALMDHPDRREEAKAELRLALNEPGDEPPAWRLHHYLGQLMTEVVDGLAEFIAAIVTAPVVDGSAPAETALGLLEGNDASSVANRLDPEDVVKLVEFARVGNSDPATVKLAAHITSLRGDTQSAWSLISSAADLQDDPQLRSTIAVARAQELVDEGEYQAALNLLAEYELHGNETAAIVPRAYALYGLDNLDKALETLIGAPSTFETATVRALVWLRRAARTSIDSRAPVISEAEGAASEAVRIDPSSGEGLLLRAQVTLEGTDDTNGGRRLLDKAVRKLGRMPERTLSWRVQQRVRDDDLFRYVTLEVAAKCGHLDELLALRREELPFKQTTYLQDGALAELIAAAYKDGGQLDDAAEFLDAAVEFYDSARQPDRALETRQAITDIRPTMARSLNLAEQYWLASFRSEQHGREAASKAVQQGLDVLDVLDARAPDQEHGDRIHGAYLRGLLLARAAQIAESPTRANDWAPLPWLLVAALDDPRHSYRAAHLAAALHRAMLYWPAVCYVGRALGLERNDSWVREMAIYVRFGWYGTLDTETRRLLSKSNDPKWRESIRAFDSLLRDDLRGLRRMYNDITFEGLWAQELRATAMSRIEGLEAAKPQWRKVIALSLKEAPPDRIAASQAALVLGDLDAASQHIEAGIAEGYASPWTVELTAALIDLTKNDQHSLERALSCVHALECPYYLRELAYRLCPVLSEAWADRPEVVAGLTRLREAAVRKLDERLSSPSPPLTVELDIQHASSSDPALDGLVYELLRIEAMRGADPEGAGEALHRLAVVAHSEPIGPALAIARTPATAALGQVP
jgi:tetratricopeptide (TPR) repeat protein